MRLRIHLPLPFYFTPTNKRYSSALDLFYNAKLPRPVKIEVLRGKASEIYFVQSRHF